MEKNTRGRTRRSLIFNKDLASKINLVILHKLIIAEKFFQDVENEQIK